MKLFNVIKMEYYWVTADDADEAVSIASNLDSGSASDSSYNVLTHIEVEA